MLQKPSCSAALYRSLPKCGTNRFPWQYNLVLHSSQHITGCFDFLPLCLRTQLKARLPAGVIRAECINLVFIYSPWRRHTARGHWEIPLPLWQRSSSLLALPVKFRDLFMTCLSGPGRLVAEVTPGSACGLGAPQPSILASGCHVGPFQASQF